MKRGLIFLAMLVSVLALGFAQPTISGTYRYSTNAYITFTGDNFTGSWNRTSTMSGTFSIIYGTYVGYLILNITGGTLTGNTWEWMIVSQDTLIDQDGDNWKLEGGGSAQVFSSDFEMNGTVLVSYRGNAANVTIPAGVTAIGDSAFQDCSLTSITIPEGVTAIGTWAFWGCTSLTSVSLPSSVISIGIGAFTCGKNLNGQHFNGSLTSITVNNQNPVYSSLEGVLFNKNRTVLIRCPEGKQGSYIIPSSVTSIDPGAFVTCTSLTNITIPSSVTSIGESAFYWCSSLTSITIPSSVTTIGEAAFSSCISLTSITIPSSVTFIGELAFNCSAILDDGTLTSITVDSQNPAYTSVEGVLFNKNRTVLIAYPVGKQGSYTVPSNVTSIGNYAFYRCSGLTSITIPSSVTSIGDEAFNGCRSMSITISRRTRIGSNAFPNARITYSD